VPVESPALHERLRSLLATYLSDNRQAWELRADGVWKQRVPEGTVVASHERLLRNSWGALRDSTPHEVIDMPDVPMRTAGD
jgi:polyphosphate kinase